MKKNQTMIPPSVHTLAQLSTSTPKPLPTKKDSKKKDSQNRLQKKARSKSLTNTILFPLIDLKSPLLKSYWTTYHCNNVQLQEGDLIKSKYCNQRWCIICNRVRTAKMINGYKEPLSQLENPYFVTLTIPNVKGKYLKSSIEGMQKNFTKIRKNLTKTYAIKIKGIRKTECTYNEKKDDYHPHYHILLSGKYEAECLINSWLAYNPTCDKKGQHMEEANKDSLMELFKYFTKVVNKGTFYPKQMDIIFRSMKNKRVFQPIGIKKQVSEDVEEIEVQKIDFKGFQTEIWVWEQTAFDWVSCHGETLTEYEPSKEFTTYLNKIAAPT